MDISQEVDFALQRKYGTLTRAAKALGVSRSTLYAKIATVEKDKEFQKLLLDAAGIDINIFAKQAEGQNKEKKVGNTDMQYNVVRLKNERVIEVWLPSDFSKTDVRTFEGWLKLIESAL